MGRAVIIDEWSITLLLSPQTSPESVRLVRAQVTRELQALCRSLARDGVSVRLEGAAEPDP